MMRNESVDDNLDGTHTNLSIDNTGNEIRENIPDINQVASRGQNEQLGHHFFPEIA